MKSIGSLRMRVPTAETEALVIATLRRHLKRAAPRTQAMPQDAHELIDHHLRDEAAPEKLSVQPLCEAAGNSIGPGLATPCQALGKGIHLIVVAPGKRQQLGGELFEP
jgi:hypothetical protein